MRRGSGASPRRVEISGYSDSRFLPGGGPQSAIIVIADWDGTKFVRFSATSQILAEVNAAGLNNAPTISADKRTLYFTRFDRRSPYKGPQIYRATRVNTATPFVRPIHLDCLGDFVEGSALSPGERLLYFHRKESGTFRLYAAAVS